MLSDLHDTPRAMRALDMTESGMRLYADRIGLPRNVRYGGQRRRTREFSTGDLIRIEAARILVEGGYTPRSACLLVHAAAGEFERLALDEQSGAIGWLAWRLSPSNPDSADIAIACNENELALIRARWIDAVIIPIAPLLRAAMGRVLAALREEVADDE